MPSNFMTAQDFFALVAEGKLGGLDIQNYIESQTDKLHNKAKINKLLIDLQCEIVAESDLYLSKLNILEDDKEIELLQLQQIERFANINNVKRFLSNELNAAFINTVNVFTDIETSENIFKKGLPMNFVVKHFMVFLKNNSKNNKQFLTEEKLRSFLLRAFLGDKEQPKQEINFVDGQKGFIIKRFYEFYKIAVNEYKLSNKKEEYINLILNNLEGLGVRSEIESYFKEGKSTKQWE